MMKIPRKKKFLKKKIFWDFLGKLIFEVPDSHIFLGVLGAWVTFKKPKMVKTLRNGLIMSETNHLNHKWLDLGI